MDLVITSSMEKKSNKFGNKTLRLEQLLNSGYNVPPFVGINIDVCHGLVNGKEDYKKVAEDIHNQLTCDVYAVRSSSLSEDDIQSSHAGEFMTKLNVLPAELSNAIRDVLDDAQAKGSVTPQKPFSLIVQKYLAPQKAGVLFTRSPRAEYATIIEWRDENGEHVVGGKNVERYSFPTNTIPKKLPFVLCDRLIGTAKKIEQEAAAPQDIEWALCNNEIFILQTRPITTISPNDYKALLFLDNNLTEKNYYYESGTLGEAFKNPSERDFDILNFLHKKDGPIARAYFRFNISYKPADIFHYFGNTLFVDKEKELQQFFPSYSYFGKQALMPHLARLSGLWTTLANTYRFQTLDGDASFYEKSYAEHASLLQNSFESTSSHPHEYWLELLSKIYTDVFAVTLVAEKKYKELEFTLKNETSSLTQVLANKKISNSKDSLDLEREILTLCKKYAVGNSLAISDESTFFAQESIQSGSDTKEVEVSSEYEAWLNTFSFAKRSYLEKRITEVLEFERLREIGRWLSVLCISGIRRELKNNVSKKENKLHEHAHLSFPKVISSLPLPVTNNRFGISAGKARGKISEPGLVVEKGDILFVATLHPSYTQYFDRIGGIISLEGGMLSHLAIIARECNIPIVVDSHAIDYCKVGMVVEIDGERGSVEVVG